METKKERIEEEVKKLGGKRVGRTGEFVEYKSPLFITEKNPTGKRIVRAEDLIKDPFGFKKIIKRRKDLEKRTKNKSLL